MPSFWNINENDVPLSAKWKLAGHKRTLCPQGTEPDCVRVKLVFTDFEQTLCRFIQKVPLNGYVLVAMAWFRSTKIVQELIAAQRERNAHILIIMFKDVDIVTDKRTRQKSVVSRMPAVTAALGTYFENLEPFDPTTDVWSRLLAKVPLVHKATPTCLTYATNWSHSKDACADVNTCLVSDDQDECAPVRVTGWHASLGANAEYKQYMHHKFVVIADRHLRVSGVWTGSVNSTLAGFSGCENATILTAPLNANALSGFVTEFARVVAMSEPLTSTHLDVHPCLVPKS